MDKLITAVKALNQSFDEFLMSRVAVLLAGKPVIIEYSDLDSCRGCIVKRDGVMVIQLDREQLDSDAELLRTMLHETAHLKLHSGIVTDQKNDTGAVVVQSGSLLYKLKRNYENKREQEARELAERWMIKAGSGTLRQRLNRLLLSI